MTKPATFYAADVETILKLRFDDSDDAISFGKTSKTCKWRSGFYVVRYEKGAHGRVYIVHPYGSKLQLPDGLRKDIILRFCTYDAENFCWKEGNSDRRTRGSWNSLKELLEITHEELDRKFPRRNARETETVG